MTMQIQGLAAFLDDLMGGSILIGLSIVIGAIAWGAVVLRGGTQQRALLQRCLALMRTGALVLAAAQAVKIIAKAGVVAGSLGEFPWSEYAATAQFQASVARVVLAVAIAACAYLPLRTRSGWVVLSVLTGALLLSGAWLVHGAGRLEGRAPLMMLTVLHQLAAGVWVGSVIQLAALWRRARATDLQSFWPIAVTRFSSLGMTAVALLLASGLALAWHYVGTWRGLLGTGYGSLVLAKSWLLAVTLAFAALNFFAGRRWLRDRADSAVTRRVPFQIEAETFLLVGLLFLAASVSSQPPARDIPNLTASIPEVVLMFSPKTPALATPAHDVYLTDEAARSALAGRPPSASGTQWSDYNHNVAGLFLTGMGLVALLSYVRGFAWARLWPCGFMALGVFLFFRSDADTWPLGPIGFWQSTLGDTGVLQHRMATALAFALGALETRSRSLTHTRRRVRFLLPVLCAFGGILLVTHAHTPFEIKRDYLIQSTHLAMGLLALILAAGRWLELRFAEAQLPLESRTAGIAGVGAMLLIGLILVFYQEPL
jgi:putative copper resistance protein D